MKRVIIAFCCILCSVSLFAQKKGDFSLGVSASASLEDRTTVINYGHNWQITEDGYPPTVTLGASIEAGYFLFKGFKLALSAGYAQQGKMANTPSGLNGTKTRAFAFAPSISYYVRLLPGLYYVPEVGGGYVLGHTDDHIASEDVHVSVKTQGYSIIVNLLSLEFKPTDRVGIALSLGQFNYSRLDGEDVQNNLYIQGYDGGFYFNTNAAVGVRFYL